MTVELDELASHGENVIFLHARTISVTEDDVTLEVELKLQKTYY